ncbi:hypothetical protein O181_107232 [Austropuccinia psidii MF-1]|uniref:Uncharacterized protein n=1 Tax=Austropuccinia psidii MF-1 TaxID=1389203 RepID=A0A9Q3PP58_9BASI|nr:hypothetical protein [Austropuccinia psidii MF-1]
MLPTLLTILMLAECPPNMLPTLLTILTLEECTPNMLPTPPILTLAECSPNMLPKLLAILTLAECSPDMLLTPLILTLPYYIDSVQWLVSLHDERNCRNMLSGLLCQQDLRGNWSVYSQCCG